MALEQLLDSNAGTSVFRYLASARARPMLEEMAKRRVDLRFLVENGQVLIACGTVVQVVKWRDWTDLG
jgi:hypothetical protein